MFNSCGVQTFICIKKSPVPYRSILGKPLPFSLRILPDWVPDSILILTFPDNVSISLLSPKTASDKFIYKSKWTLVPSLFKVWCCISSINTNKSPDNEFFPGASFPFPPTFNWTPSVTPAGILIDTVSSFTTKPWASDPLGLLEIISPDPWQVPQVVAVCILPRMVLVTRICCPDPLQVVQVLYLTPSAWIFLRTFTFFSTPLAISSNVNFTRIRILVPFTLAWRWPPPPKPPKPPPPKISPNWLKISSIFIPPPPKPPPPWAPSKAAWPYWS